MIEGALVAGLRSAGASVALFGLATTPCMYYSLLGQVHVAQWVCACVTYVLFTIMARLLTHTKHWAGVIAKKTI